LFFDLNGFRVVYRFKKSVGDLTASWKSVGRADQQVMGIRKLFMVLSPRSLPYARLALRSLFANCVEDFHLSLITDTAEDLGSLLNELAQLSDVKTSEKKTASVHMASELGAVARDRFSKHPHILGFQQGHPCWRKITDPILLSEGQDEMVVLDPDIYFPNRFCFEETPETGVFLMWQRPSCLLPDLVVEKAIHSKIPLAHHTDIGVAQWRLPADLDWLDWLIGTLGSSKLPRSMHVESIVWAALAMRLGGGHLNPRFWVCWHRTQYKRALVKLGVQGVSILRREPYATMKCFHAGGEAKWWLARAQAFGMLDCGGDLTLQTNFIPYQELRPAKYLFLQGRRNLLRNLGYYSLFEAS
jgi:hypothetical protein